MKYYSAGKKCTFHNIGSTAMRKTHGTNLHPRRTNHTQNSHEMPYVCSQLHFSSFLHAQVAHFVHNTQRFVVAELKACAKNIHLPTSVLKRYYQP